MKGCGRRHAGVGQPERGVRSAPPAARRRRAASTQSSGSRRVAAGSQSQSRTMWASAPSAATPASHGPPGSQGSSGRPPGGPRGCRKPRSPRKRSAAAGPPAPRWAVNAGITRPAISVTSSAKRSRASSAPPLARASAMRPAWSQVEQQVRRAEQGRHRRHGQVPVTPRLQDGERHGKRDAGQEQAIHHDGRNRRPRRHQHPSCDPEPRQRREPPARGCAEAAPRPRRGQQKPRQHRRGEPENHLVRVPRGAREIGLARQQLPRHEVPKWATPRPRTPRPADRTAESLC